MTDETDFDLQNCVIAARRGAPELDVVIDRILGNIFVQRIKEMGTREHVHYGLFGLTGTYTLIQSFLDEVTPRPKIKDQYRDTVIIHYMPDNKLSGFEMAACNGYRKPGDHWSEREKNERFFVD